VVRTAFLGGGLADADPDAEVVLGLEVLGDAAQPVVAG